MSQPWDKMFLAYFDPLSRKITSVFSYYPPFFQDSQFFRENAVESYSCRFVRNKGKSFPSLSRGVSDITWAAESENNIWYFFFLYCPSVFQKNQFFLEWLFTLLFEGCKKLFQSKMGFSGKVEGDKKKKNLRSFSDSAAKNTLELPLQRPRKRLTMFLAKRQE